MARPILISLSPNTDKTDVLLALKLIFQPWRWQTGSALARLESVLKKYFRFSYCYLLNSGRSGLYLALKSLNLGTAAEVLYPSVTCRVVPEAIKKAGAKAVSYADNKIKAKVTSHSKVLIIQHRFGIPDQMEEIIKLCQQQQLVLIEDLAHGLGASYKGRKLGTFGEMTVLSFGRDKIISSIFGGALLSKTPLVLPRLSYPGKFWIFKQLLHPLIFSLAVPTYFTLGKFIVFFCRELKLITLPLQDLPVQRLPNALAELAWHQWQKLERLNQHRRQIARVYCRAFKRQFNPEATYLRFPLKVRQPRKLIEQAKKQQVWLGDWYEGTSVNLPTHWRMSLADSQRVVKIVKEYVASQKH